MTTDAIQVHTTTATKEDAQRIAARLLDRREAACVQISGPLESHYRWQGRRESSQEWLCTIKTTAARYDDVERSIREVHPYEEPEILAVPVLKGSAGYLRWLADETRPEAGERRGDDSGRGPGGGDALGGGDGPGGDG